MLWVVYITKGRFYLIGVKWGKTKRLTSSSVLSASIYSDGSSRINWLSRLPLHNSRWWECSTLCCSPTFNKYKIKKKKKKKKKSTTEWNNKINTEEAEMVAVLLFAFCSAMMAVNEKMTHTWIALWYQMKDRVKSPSTEPSEKKIVVTSTTDLNLDCYSTVQTNHFRSNGQLVDL